jgi:guanine deaminase
MVDSHAGGASQPTVVGTSDDDGSAAAGPFVPAYLARALEIAAAGAASGAGGPFGAVLVRDGEIFAEGHNMVLATNDPTAHAEVTVIREACRKLGHFQLLGFQLYSSCEPCPMCLGAVYWARPDVVYFAGTQADARYGGFDDQFIYDEIVLPPTERRIPFVQIETPGARTVFDSWLAKTDRTPY